MARLSIALLGGFRVSLDGQPLTQFVSDKGRALLAYLVIEAGRPHRRETLAALLWPERPSSASRTNLRQTLHRLRLQIDVNDQFPSFLLIDAHQLQFNNRSSYWLDVHEFTESFDAFTHQSAGGILVGAECLGGLQAAIDLYRGDFMSGFTLAECPDYEWWLLSRQEELHRQALDILDCLFLHYERCRDYIQASACAQRAIELEPWSERAHRQKMHALASGGQRAAALHQYRICSGILAAELGVKPSAQTTRLFQAIRDGSSH